MEKEAKKVKQSQLQTKKIDAKKQKKKGMEAQLDAYDAAMSQF